MIFLPSCSIHVSSVPEPADSHGSTVLPVTFLGRFVRNSMGITTIGTGSHPTAFDISNLA